MKRAAIYSRVDPKDRSAMPAHKATAEAMCREQEWDFVHYSDSASGNRPPMQFATQSQLIRPQLTRLLSEVEAGRVFAVIPSSSDALASNSELFTRIEGLLEQHGLVRQEHEGEIGYYYLRRG